MKAIIKKLIKPNGDHFFTIYTVDSEGKEKFIDSKFFSPLQKDKTFSNHESVAYSRAMELAKVLEGNGVQETEVTIYETPTDETEKEMVGIDLSKIDEP